ncbi:MAG: dienelactone hydrolase family protein [Vulcanococcus sp.]|uniref:dienelactone hydrolase family protein n=1 Tax=Vulcanococcus sp. TaxID=2856995 RepID=UPI0025DC06BD|nr:dienelactone hydrolase family protein [Vulcanococcus sp.]MBW0167164.1 dienelactone hydrolase family protein [Vulcanococcus sp.]
MAIQANWIEVNTLEGSMPAWWARPQAPRAALLVLPEVFGVNGWVRSVADRLAEQGYAALAISTFWRTAPHLEADYNDAGLALGREHRDQVQADQLRSDVTAAAAWMQQAHAANGLDHKPLGCVGFCFGGHLAMLAATLPVLAATCDFYGARVSTDRPGGGVPTLTDVPQVPGRLWCFCGDQDPLMPPEELSAIEQALAAAPGNRHRFVRVPGAGHGYMCEARADFNAEASAAGWAAMLELFGQAL